MGVQDGFSMSKVRGVRDFYPSLHGVWSILSMLIYNVIVT